MKLALVAQYLLGLVLMVLFAFMNANYPDKTWLFFTLYLLVFMGIIFLITGRQARSIFRDIEEIKSGEVLLEANPEEVLRLREKDMDKTQGELAAQVKASLIPFVTMILFIVVFYVPPLRSFFSSIGSSLSTDQRTANFYSFLAMYGAFYVLSLITGLYTRRLQARTGTLTIATKYVITTKGIIVDDRLPVKFPIQGSLKTDTKRKFVEVTLKQQVMGNEVKQRVRLYTPEPSKLASIIKVKGLGEDSLSKV
ncbi:DUF2208 domain-containing protein [Infirmifilum sp. NZ]|uniref:DUF2208 domain-containing protein n=1 Tax=Infirmifilum sp. NZ TaxID=2926850 RepID=UPI0027AAD454|nr:DUF2208 domain-containing protein [Infirmifilum sp. NZ]UNQ72959.1 DUF2208 domain-containing protein [Infirmifilum sp. NZ]